MIENGYVSLNKIKVKRTTKILHWLLNKIFPDYIKLPTVQLSTLGQGLVFANLIFQKIIGVNKHLPFMAHYTSRIVLPRGIKIEAHSESASVYASFAASGGCYITAHNGVEFKRGARFAPGVKIISADHDLANLDESKSAESIKIGAYVWIGANAVILPGVEIGDNSVVAAASLVTKNIPAGEIWGGVPAKKLRSIDIPQINKAIGN